MGRLNGRKCKERDSCVAACINTLMDRDDCPHFFDGVNDADEAWSKLRDWMRGYGKDLMLFPYLEDPRELTIGVINESPYILMYYNGQGDHAAIFQGSERVFDPAWISNPVEGPMTCGYWLVGVVVDYIK